MNRQISIFPSLFLFEFKFLQTQKACRMLGFCYRDEKQVHITFFATLFLSRFRVLLIVGDCCLIQKYLTVETHTCLMLLLSASSLWVY